MVGKTIEFVVGSCAKTGSGSAVSEREPFICFGSDFSRHSKHFNFVQKSVQTLDCNTTKERGHFRVIIYPRESRGRLSQMRCSSESNNIMD
jgi:hypothetical protein